MLGAIDGAAALVDQRQRVCALNPPFRALLGEGGGNGPVEGRSIYDLARGKLGVEALRTLLEETLLKQKRVESFKLPRNGASRGKPLSVHARLLPGDPPMTLIQVEPDGE